MGNISSSTLFNFTDNIEHLLNNLEHGIYCHTSLEKLPGNRHAYEVPFCCFCDIPLSLISEHFEWYGEYGIGLKREYAREHNTQPVHYVTSESRFLKNITRKKTENISNNTKQYLIPYLKKFPKELFGFNNIKAYLLIFFLYISTIGVISECSLEIFLYLSISFVTFELLNSALRSSILLTNASSLSFIDVFIFFLL